jgi:hypothetical protein
LILSHLQNLSANQAAQPHVIFGMIAHDLGKPGGRALRSLATFPVDLASHRIQWWGTLLGVGPHI